MIKALLLIFEPGNCWDKIVEAKRSLSFVLFVHVIPMIALSTGAELLGLIQLGQHHPHSLTEIVKVPQRLALSYGLLQFLLSLAVIFICAQFISLIAQTFHGRNTYGQCFTLVAYSSSPLFLIHMGDAFPVMNPWVTFGVGIALCLCVLYNGVPRTLLPDPPHAFGLFMMSAFILAVVAGLARVLELLLLERRIQFI